ncbi:MAG TPA: hypothetical protein VN611_05025 [Patescibacteria group bacterium]|nr:hypothetical protein [Patescibacteria group bacterium]
MGLFDSLFGSKPEPKKKKVKSEAVAPVAPASSSDEGVSPELIAAIAASMYVKDDAAVVAAITAAVYEMMGTTNLVVRIRRTSSSWAVSGRQKLMDSREFA